MEIQIEASPLEHALATTDPRELASGTSYRLLMGQPRRITSVLHHDDDAMPEDAEGQA